MKEAEFEEHYAQARNLFWRAQYHAAEARFAQLADLTSNSEDRARTLYQKARCIEMRGDWLRAAAAYDRVAELDSLSQWTPAGLFASLRLLWRSGYEEQAYNRYKTLISNRRWRTLGGRAALFLLASDLVRGRTERAPEWFLHIRRLGGVETVETAYWKGRLEQLEGRDSQAVRRYVESVRSSPFHPLAQLALTRLGSDPLAEATRNYADQAARSPRSEELFEAWLLLGDDNPLGSQARQSLISRLQNDRRSRTRAEPHSSFWLRT